MALTKVTKHIIHGSLLVQFKYADLSDKTVSSSTQTFQAVGSALVITPLYSDSILETTFSGSLQDSMGDRTSDQTNIALYVNGSQEYLQSELQGGSQGGNNWQQHGGDHDRVLHGIIHAHFHDFRMSVGFTHSFTPNSTNAQSIEVRIRNQDNNGRTLHMREGFLIAKEISVGLSTTGQI